VFGVFHVAPAAIGFSDDSAVFVIDSDGPANRCVVPGRRVTSSNTAYSKASLQFQLLGREKGPFSELNRRGSGFSGAMRISGSKDFGSGLGGCLQYGRGESEPEAENYPPSSIRRAENGNETIDL
jgi:hypothetical protein